MDQTISPASLNKVFPLYAEKPTRISILKKFSSWCERQEENRLLWLGIGIMGHIGMVLPLTLLSILFLANNNFILWIVVLAANMPVLAFNLAAQPPKVTIPVMVVSLFINIIVALTSLVTFML